MPGPARCGGGLPVRRRGIGVQGCGEDVRALRPGRRSAATEPQVRAGTRGPVAGGLPGHRPGYHLNKRHWNTVTLDGSLPDQMVTDLLGDSYDLVVASLPRARRPAGPAAG